MYDSYVDLFPRTDDAADGAPGHERNSADQAGNAAGDSADTVVTGSFRHHQVFHGFSFSKDWLKDRDLQTYTTLECVYVDLSLLY